MMQNSDYGLTRPPRQVPWPIQTQVLLGGFSSQFGWLFFGFGMLFVWVFGAFTMLNSVYFWVGTVDTAPGTVAAVNPTNSSENDTPVYANQFVFRVESREEEYRGESYTTGQQFSVGNDVTIEYLRDNPEISRIQGTRSGTFGPWVFCFVLIFPAVGLGFIIISVLMGIKGNHLLKHGQVTTGKLISKEATNTRINNQTVYKLTFEFTADNGLRYETSARSHRPYNLEDEDAEQIVYDPANPHHAVLVDNLPGAPDIDEFGQIYVANPARSLVVLILPVLAVTVHSGIFLYVMLRL